MVLARAVLDDHDRRDGVPEVSSDILTRVIVTDRVKTDSGWEDGATIGYDVAVNGRQAVGLVEAAEASGNIRVMFEGEYRVRRYAPEGGEPRDIHEVRGATVGASFAGQKVVIEKREGDAAPADDDTPF